MYRLIFAIGLLVCSLSGMWSQEPLDFNTINQESYRLYQAGDWDGLIAIGKISLKQDVDYFYLRMRMGIAFHEQKNYRKAAGHFEKALEFNQDDPVALEYLYYALLLGGQHEKASHVREQFKGNLAEELPPNKARFFDHARGEFLYNNSLTDNLLNDTEGLFANLPAGVQNVTRHYSNLSLSLSNRLAPGIRLNHTYTYLSKTNYQYYNDGLNLFQIPDQHVYQHQYYISPSFTTKSGFTLMPAFHLVSIHYQAPVNFGQGFQGGASQVELGYLDEIDYMAGMGFSKEIGTADLYLGAWYATLNNKEQVQNKLGITWYPFGNLNFYAGGFMNSQYEISDGDNVIRIIPELNVGGSLGERVWLDLSLALGEMTNYLEQNGAIIFNSFSDVVQKKVVLTMSVPFTQKGSLLYLGGRWTAHQSDFYSITYNAISIYGGISWKF
jgi:tetratricopeptide (TPR) repeat protein